MNDKSKNDSNSFDEFEDIFSASKPDGFEDFFSDSQVPDAPKDADSDAFEDIFSGRAEAEEPAYDEDPYADFFSGQPGADNPAQPFRPAVNTAPEKKPYAYHYNDDRSTTRKRARNGDEIFSGAQPPEKPKRKRHLGLKIFAGLFVTVLLLLLAAGGYVYSQAKKALDAVNYKPLEANTHIASADLARSDSVRNILLIGVDAREGEDAEKTRADTMLLVSIDAANQQIKLTSFLRDLYLEIPGYRADKLNAAQSHGGTQLLVDTLEYNFKIDIDNYMLVSFDMFTSIIDKLGGVDLEITEKEAKYLNSHDRMGAAEIEAFREPVSAGEVHFNGVQALWYGRIRYLDSDFMRTSRQRKVITSIVKTAAGTSPTTLFDMAQAVMPMVQTDLTSEEIMDIGLHGLSYLGYDIVQQQIPAQDAYESGRRRKQSVLLPDMEKNRTILNRFLFEKVAVTEEETQKAG